MGGGIQSSMYTRVRAYSWGLVQTPLAAFYATQPPTRVLTRPAAWITGAQTSWRPQGT